MNLRRPRIVPGAFLPHVGDARVMARPPERPTPKRLTTFEAVRRLPALLKVKKLECLGCDSLDCEHHGSMNGKLARRAERR